MQTYVEFAKQFDINNPQEYSELLNKYQMYIDALRMAYDNAWTYCPGCAKTVPSDTSQTFDTLVGTKIKRVTRCPQCGIPWYIRDKEDDLHG